MSNLDLKIRDAITEDGYAIGIRIEEISNDFLGIGSSTVAETLDRLEGIIHSIKDAAGIGLSEPQAK